jgi:hypothetical protein
MPPDPTSGQYCAVQQDSLETVTGRSGQAPIFRRLWAGFGAQTLLNSGWFYRHQVTQRLLF